ncbi:SRPBCC domain-containing protein [Nocardioides bruguierae]|uniref:SRPBCC domain-containing protein n=1 Tax=Nocardioides bruguierae TaxID=2945102 RepID=A0A9X2IGI5_9ACTN|nr:SRPBCC domain-containing protein [Nocardioides bruguierae]MCM0622058.1 SRPBCC domain-containing protein [Nocardioides bruguierae]
MTRTDQAALRLAAAPPEVFAALVGREALEAWLPPAGMTGRFEHFDPRTGGSYRLVLAYDDGGQGAQQGKTTAGSDVVEARYVEVEPGARVVQAVDFVSDDPAFAGTMTMTWEVAPRGDGTLVRVRAEDVPAGIDAEVHTAALASSLDNLARHLGEAHVVLRGVLVCRDESETRVVTDHLDEHVALTRAEPGCLDFAVHPGAEPRTWSVAERFVDADAFRAHQARIATSAWGAATAGIERRYEVTGLDG